MHVKTYFIGVHFLVCQIWCLLQCLARLVLRKTKAVRTVCNPYSIFSVKSRATVLRLPYAQFVLKPLVHHRGGFKVSLEVCSTHFPNLHDSTYQCHGVTLQQPYMCCYNKRLQRKPNDASGKEPKGSQQLRRCLKETAAVSMFVSEVNNAYLFHSNIIHSPTTPLLRVLFT